MAIANEQLEPQPATAAPSPEQQSAGSARGELDGPANPWPLGLLQRRHAGADDPLGGTEADDEVAAALVRRRGRGDPLPADLAQSMGAAMGTDLGGVRVHTGSEPARIARSIQATAFTQGQDIYFGAGAYAPGTSAGKALLAHELAHTLQPSGPATSGSRPVIGAASDPAEVDADRVAARTMQTLRRHVQRPPAAPDPNDGTPALQRLAPCTDQPGHRPGPDAMDLTRLRRSPDDSIIRRTLSVGGAPCIDAEATYAEMVKKVTGNYLPTNKPFAEEFSSNKVAIIKTLKAWIEASNYQPLRALYGQTPARKTYTDYEDLAAAVLGDALAADNLVKENALAKKTMASAYIDQQLNLLLPKLAARFESVVGESIEKQLGNSHKGTYWPWYYVGVTGGFSDVFTNPSSYSISAKVSAVHDLTDFYLRFRPTEVRIQPAQDSSTKRDGSTVALGTFRGADGTLDEKHEAIVEARLAFKPIQMGPSYTTGRYMAMLANAGGSIEERRALANALFAFWNQGYTTSASGVHRFHFVMDMAKNFGVPYNMADGIPSEPPTGAPTKSTVGNGWVEEFLAAVVGTVVIDVFNQPAKL